MKTHIVINKRIYENYKDEILPLSARLFCDEYFYDLKNYKQPVELNGIKNYLLYTKQITIYTTATFLDFVNVLLVLSFLKENNYQNDIIINYYLLNSKTLDEALFMSTNLKGNELEPVETLLSNIKNKNKLTNVSLKLPGMINYINFFNMISDKENFNFYFQELIEECEDDIEELAECLYEKYNNMGLNKQFYLDLIKEYK